MAPRRNDPELMDSPGVPYDDLEIALQDLDVINRWLGGYRTTRIGVGRLIRDLPAGTPVSVLDLGCGGTDLSGILRPLNRKFMVTSLDINPLMREFALRHDHTSDVVIGSALALPYPDRSFDIVHASLFLHHCTDAEVTHLVRRATRIARLGVVINELQRHAFAAAGISLLTTLFARSPIVRHDAPLSVRRGFTRKELEAILAREVTGDVTTSWQWAFRWCLSIPPAQQVAGG